jgi:transcriptional regulator with XRE-family HTH domain
MRLEAILGENVRRLRNAKDLSQEALAAEAGIDMRYLGGIERGQENPTLSVIKGVADALGTTIIVLLTESRGAR